MLRVIFVTLMSLGLIACSSGGKSDKGAVNTTPADTTPTPTIPTDDPVEVVPEPEKVQFGYIFKSPLILSTDPEEAVLAVSKSLSGPGYASGGYVLGCLREKNTFLDDDNFVRSNKLGFGEFGYYIDNKDNNISSCVTLTINASGLMKTPNVYHPNFLMNFTQSDASLYDYSHGIITPLNPGYNHIDLVTELALIRTNKVSNFGQHLMSQEFMLGDEVGIHDPQFANLYVGVIDGFRDNLSDILGELVAHPSYSTFLQEINDIRNYWADNGIPNSLKITHTTNSQFFYGEKLVDFGLDLTNPDYDLMFERLAAQMVLTDILGEVLTNDQAFEYFLYSVSLGSSISNSRSSTLDYCDLEGCFDVVNNDDEGTETGDDEGTEIGDNEGDETGGNGDHLSEVELSLHITNLPVIVDAPANITEGYRNPENFADVVCENGNIAVNFWTEQELDRNSEDSSLYFYSYGSGDVYEGDKCMLISTNQPMSYPNWFDPYSLYIGAVYDSGVSHFDLISTLAVARANKLSHYAIFDTKLEEYSEPIELFGANDINEFVSHIIPDESDYLHHESDVISQISLILLYNNHRATFDNWLQLQYLLFGGELKHSYPSIDQRARDNYIIMMSLGVPYDARHIRLLVEEYAASGDLLYSLEVVRNAEF